MNFLKPTIFLILCLVTLIRSQPSTLTIAGQIFDQHPMYNNNFEPRGGNLRTGLVEKTLSDNKLPKLISSVTTPDSLNDQGRMVTPALFTYFFSTSGKDLSPNSGANVPIGYDIVLNYDTKKGVYVFDNQAFFPIDERGFDTNKFYRNYTDGSKYHNFHFCLKMNTKFTFQGYEVFNFIGDDDVWVFINNKLAVDLGGLHSRESGSVDLTKLGLTKGVTYDFDFYYCERHTTASTIRIETNMQVFCPFEDYCGVCSGDGSTCCNKATTCNDGKKCTIDACPPPNADIKKSGSKITDADIYPYCSHTDVVCDAPDLCTNNACDENTGNCKTTPITCNDQPAKCLLAQKCDPNSGCIYKSKCDGVCDTGACSNGDCVQKTNNTCANELGNNPCMVYSCGKNGCEAKPKCPQNPATPCDVSYCEAGECKIKHLNATECDCGCDRDDLCHKNNCVDNKCVPIPIDGTDDGNECTEDTCVNGEIFHTPINKCSGCMTCNTKTGDCDLSDKKCQDGNECTSNSCQATDTLGLGECTNTTVVCGATNTDKCIQFSCNETTGCSSSAVVCPNEGNCLVGYCDSNKGCLTKPRSCDTGVFCLVGECIEHAGGCVVYEKRCDADNGKCQQGVCVNGTSTEEGRCKSENYDPLPFICKTAAVVSTAVIAGVTVAGAVALGAFIYGGKRGYDYWKDTRNVQFSGSNSNPLYEQNPNGSGVNPLYNDNSTL
ncbi:hypothetical protein RB653_008924 [Dictyostelium firmibasis]|uniref:PA14 domain-containing protein n=1 Tax=Dictyostelium firmibasis TaxID=79012 RepID=A0AAN7YPP3_9MYCE